MEIEHIIARVVRVTYVVYVVVISSQLVEYNLPFEPFESAVLMGNSQKLVVVAVFAGSIAKTLFISKIWR